MEETIVELKQEKTKIEKRSASTRLKLPTRTKSCISQMCTFMENATLTKLILPETSKVY
jgi:hypothetical protein